MPGFSDRRDLVADVKENAQKRQAVVILTRD